MSTSASKALQAVKAHIPLIKFRKGGVTRSHDNSASPPGIAAPSSPPIGLTPRGSGIEEQQLPQRYLRKPLTSLEMEIIERGGPDKL